MKSTTTINTVIGLLQTEALLERHLEDTRQDIRRACADIAAHTPGVKITPDIDMVDVYIPLEGAHSNTLEDVLDRMGRPDIRLIVEPCWVPMTEDELTEDGLEWVE